MRQRSPVLAEQAQSGAEHDRDQQNLQNIALGEGVDEGRRNDPQQEIDRTGDLTEMLRIGGHRLRIERTRIDVHADAGSERVREHDAETKRNGGDDLEVDDGFHADAADLAQVACADDAMHHDAEHERRDRHLDELDEGIAERLERYGKAGPQDPDHDAEHERNDHLAEQRLQEVWH